MACTDNLIQFRRSDGGVPGSIDRTPSVIAMLVGNPLCPTVTRPAPLATDSVMLTCSTHSAIRWKRAAFSVALRSQSSTMPMASGRQVGHDAPQ